MGITRRRKRRPDLFASANWVRSIFDKLKADFPLLSSLREKELVKLARAVRHVERYSATDTRRGRPSRWPREDVIRVGSKLGEILSRETNGRISVATFVDHYLRILDFPSDVMDALLRGEINLFEAEQLSRLTAKRLDTSQPQARRKRSEMLLAHLKSQASGERLRQRINDLFRQQKSESAGLAAADSAADKAAENHSSLEDFDPYDSTHLFWEEIKQLGFAFREIRREDLDNELLEELLNAAEPVWKVLRKIKTIQNKKRAEKLAF